MTLAARIAVLLFTVFSVLNPALSAPRPAAAPAQSQGSEAVAAQTALPGSAPAAQTYRLTAWSELGMHCIDGKDYSIFSILPPYNIIHAQLLLMGSTPTPITSGVTITYQSFADSTGSINTISSTKTNFWTYVYPLFLTAPAPDVGLTGNYVQSRVPRPLTYNSTLGYWESVGIPTVPYDDKLNSKPFPMIAVVAKDLTGKVLATAKIVVPVSDEISCSNCHASGSDKDAMPPSGWVYNTDPAKDAKLNVLRYHDDKINISSYLPQLATLGYNYLSSLEQTALNGTPVLCAVCHSSNALGTAGLPGIESETRAMHANHGPVYNYATGKTLDQSNTNQGSCYLCHPGPKTQCLRGAMSKNITCMGCHGNVSYVGGATRIGWITLPACQMCHENSLRYTKAFDKPGHWRVATDQTFATNQDVPQPGANLYRYSMGHGNQYCSSCHGSQHAEFPTSQLNDNVYSTQLQGYKGQIRECTVCHNPVPVTLDQGPHGIHTVGQSWVDQHGNYVQNTQTCTYCHAADYRGSFLSQLKVKKTFNAGDYGIKTFTAGHQMNCYDCHNGPNGG